MAFLEQVTTGKIKLPYSLCIYGTDGVGKTTFAAAAPKPILIELESGSAQIDIARMPKPDSFPMLMQMLEELLTSDHKYKTLVVDSLDWLEPHLWDELSKEYKVANIEKVEGGFYKGYTIVLKKWKQLFDKLESIRLKRMMNYILIAHSESAKFNDTDNNVEYKRSQLKLNVKAANFVREAVDAVLYATYEVFTHKDDQKKVRAYSEGARIVYTERRPQFDAKNRLGLPFQLPLSWEDFDQAARKGDPDSVEAIKNRLEGLVQVVSDPDGKIKEAVRAEMAKEPPDARRLAQFENKLKQIVHVQEDK